MGKPWARKPEDVPIDKLRKASLICYKNGCDLLQDAELLQTNNRYGTSIALSILSEEEFTKAYMLHSCSIQPRWDSVIWKALILHPEKQAISEGMRQVMVLRQRQINHNKFIDNINQVSLIPAARYNFITPDAVNRVVNPIKETHIKKRQIDKIKQSKLYIEISQEGDITNIPTGNKTEAFSYVDMAKGLKSIVEEAYEELGVDYNNAPGKL